MTGAAEKRTGQQAAIKPEICTSAEMRVDAGGDE